MPGLTDADKRWIEAEFERVWDRFEAEQKARELLVKSEVGRRALQLTVTIVIVQALFSYLVHRWLP